MLQTHTIHSDGFSIVHHAITPATLRTLLHVLAPLPPAHARRNLLRHRAIHHFAISDEALSFITPHLGPHPLPVRGILFDKLPGANWKVAWHQDLSIAVNARHDLPGYGPWSLKEGVPHVQPPRHILESMLTLRLHLDDCLRDNGPVRLLPGTHNRGILTPDEIHHLRQNLPEVPATCHAGGILLMRPLALHASSPTTAASSTSNTPLPPSPPPSAGTKPKHPPHPTHRDKTKEPWEESHGRGNTHPHLSSASPKSLSHTTSHSKSPNFPLQRSNQPYMSPLTA